jgi:hypothetical protein
MIYRLIDRKRLPEGKAYIELAGEAACPESLKTQFPPHNWYTPFFGNYVLFL